MSLVNATFVSDVAGAQFAVDSMMGPERSGHRTTSGIAPASMKARSAIRPVPRRQCWS